MGVVPNNEHGAGMVLSPGPTNPTSDLAKEYAMDMPEGKGPMMKCEKCGYKGKGKECPKCHGKMMPMGLSDMMKSGKK